MRIHRAVPDYSGPKQRRKSFLRVRSAWIRAAFDAVATLQRALTAGCHIPEEWAMILEELR